MSVAVNEGDEAAVEFESRVDATLQMTCELARALVGAHQAAMSLIVAGDWAHARKYFSHLARSCRSNPFSKESHMSGEINVTSPDKPKTVLMVIANFVYRDFFRRKLETAEPGILEEAPVPALAGAAPVTGEEHPPTGTGRGERSKDPPG